ncbi:MAG TPA: GtrA family protein [Candidatus Didemnitutus sp.]|nr:GtrA family protein [Candidatus Didemnitutus sp.]
MQNLLAPTAHVSLKFRLYRYRFLLVYIAIGVASLWVEIFVLRGLNYLGTPNLGSQLLGLVAGIFFAFWMNVRFNFKVPVAKRNRALAYFAGISLLSAAINFLFKRQLVEHGWTYEQARFAGSAVLFSFGYLLHRRFSFVDRKQVGVAVYATGVEDIRGIREKIGDFPDFIHVDLIDSSFGPKDTDVRSYRLETIQAYWPKRAIHVHLMTRHPLKWLPEVLPYADVVIVHVEIDDPLEEVIRQVKQAGRQVGLCLQMTTPVEAARAWSSQVKVLMLLTIPIPGRSGQTFQLESLEKVREINSWADRSHFSLCVDGGINETNVHLLNVELAVSGSSVLQAADPARQIMRLQTSNNHEAI